MKFIYGLTVKVDTLLTRKETIYVVIVKSSTATNMPVIFAANMHRDKETEKHGKNRLHLDTEDINQREFLYYDTEQSEEAVLHQ